MQPASRALVLTGVVVFCALLMVVSRDVLMGGVAVAGFAVALGFFCQFGVVGSRRSAAIRE